MEQIGFIGSYDKKDLLLNVAKILSNLNKNVLIVDATSFQRLRYIVPRISNAQGNTYVSEYLDIDVALGFMNLNGIMQYLGHNLDYDFILIDTDNIQTLNSFMIPTLAKNFFVTSYDEYELQRGLEVFRMMQRPMEIYKVIYSADISVKEDAYLNHLLENCNVSWKNEKVQFADTTQDKKAALENQLVRQISLRRYSSLYKDSMEYLISLIAGEQVNQDDIRRVIKKI